MALEIGYDIAASLGISAAQPEPEQLEFRRCLHRVRIVVASRALRGISRRAISAAASTTATVNHAVWMTVDCRRNGGKLEALSAADYRKGHEMCGRRGTAFRKLL